MRVVKCFLIFVIVLSSVCGTAIADRQTSIALSIGAFFPQSSATGKTFGDTWSRISLNTFETTKPEKWMFSPEIGSYRLSSSTSAQLYPVTAGFERGLNKSSKAQPYLVFRAGPYYGRVSDSAIGLQESNVGLNTNAAFGVVFAHRFYLEARYDYFSPIAGYNFNGFSVSAGVRLFDLRK